MEKIRLRYVQAFEDRYGKLRCYFRREGFKRIALPGLPYSAEFMETYEAALAGEVLEKRESKDAESKHVKSGSVKIEWICKNRAGLPKAGPNVRC
jgi:hypothetical protein